MESKESKSHVAEVKARFLAENTIDAPKTLQKAKMFAQGKQEEGGDIKTPIDPVVLKENAKGKLQALKDAIKGVKDNAEVAFGAVKTFPRKDNNLDNPPEANNIVDAPPSGDLPPQP